MCVCAEHLLCRFEFSHGRGKQLVKQVTQKSPKHHHGAACHRLMSKLGHFEGPSQPARV